MSAARTQETIAHDFASCHSPGRLATSLAATTAHKNFGAQRNDSAHSPAVKQRRPRDNRIDLIRGLALAMIFINHLPGNWLENWTSRNFGFSDAAEIFVLLAGYAAGLAFNGHVARGDLRAASLKAGRRAGQLYVAHIVTTLAAVVMFGIVMQSTGLTQDYDLIGIEPLLAAPVMSAVSIVTGGLQLSYFNILPMYVVLLALLPVMLWLAARDLRLLAAASVACYFATNIGGLALPSCEHCESWFFNPLAWQALFVVGLWLGFNRCKGVTIPYHRAAYALAIAYIIFAAVWTLRSSGGSLASGTLPAWLGSLHKSHMPVTRLLHVLALAYVVCHSRIWTQLERLPANFVLTRMGRNSLPVFMTGSMLSMLGWIFLTHIQGGAYAQTVVVATGLTIMAIAAVWIESGLKLPMLRVGASPLIDGSDLVAAR